VTDPMQRHDRFIKEHVHDPYKLRMKLSEPLFCSRCGAVYHEGRWQWREYRPMGATGEICPACHRIADDCPAGILTIEGVFAEDHRDEILGLLRNEEQAETAQHPLNRIMAVTHHDGGGMTVTTTEIHLARRLGEALHHAYRGELSFHYPPEEYLLRLRWLR
jgi:hypothetical protein